MRIIVLVLTCSAGLLAGTAVRAGGQSGGAAPAWMQDFAIDPASLVPTGRNPFLILEPGHQLVLEKGDERLVITVLAETRTVGGVTTRVVEERETEGGALVEVSRNYLAIDRVTRDVYYFGEDVDNYRGGEVVGHEGSWLADGTTNKPGLIMPGDPQVGASYYQEVAPGLAMDRAEVVSLDARVKAPAGTFEGCLKVEETTPLEPREREYKLYARDIGLLSDEGLRLVKHGTVKLPGR